MFNIRPLEQNDADNYAGHLIRHIFESGTGDNPIYTPVVNPPREDEISIAKKKKWAAPLAQPNWGRSWGAFLENRIIGHLDIDGSHIASAMHRVDLSMGLEEAFRNQKLGTQLMDQAIAWIKTQKFIEYVDLGVFTHNKSAIKLYSNYGFKEIGRIEDRFRIFNDKVDDIIMTLTL